MACGLWVVGTEEVTRAGFSRALTVIDGKTKGDYCTGWKIGCQETACGCLLCIDALLSDYVSFRIPAMKLC